MVYFKLQNKTKQEAEWAAIIQMTILVDIWLDHIHNDIITCNTEEPQQKYRLETVSHRLQEMGVGGASTCFTGSKQSPSSSSVI